MTERILVTGAAGFVGEHAVEYLSTKGFTVFGFDCKPPSLELSHVTFQTGDLRDKETMEGVVSSSRPDVVYHFAGVTKSGNPVSFYDTNVIGTVNLFEAIERQGLRPTVLIASSSAIYGVGSSRKAITEACDIRPVTHYGVSKAAQEAVARRCFLSTRLPVLFARTFNLIGPGQPLGFACPDFAHQIASAETGTGTRTLKTGNLKTERDFIDVRDAIRAYALIVESGRAGLAYNVCSGKSISIGECLEILLRMAKVSLATATDKNQVQTDDVQFQVGSSARLRRHTSWKPEMSLQRSLRDLLDYWRGRVGYPEQRGMNS